MQDLPQIVYQDPDILVIDKPYGLLTHQKHGADDSETVVSWLLELYPEIGAIKDHLDTSEAVLRPGIVHRLDRETSGLLVIAKTQSAFDYLKNLFQTRGIQKTYIALVYGDLKTYKGTIDAPIGKIGLTQTTRLHGKHELASKEAITDYRVLERFGDYTLLEVKPHTGRTHQIRIHLKSIGHPIVCDSFYAGDSKVCPPELGRLFLHAQKLELTTPAGKALTVETDLPPKLEHFLLILRDIAKKNNLR